MQEGILVKRDFWGQQDCPTPYFPQAWISPGSWAEVGTRAAGDIGLGAGSWLSMWTWPRQGHVFEYMGSSRPSMRPGSGSASAREERLDGLSVWALQTLSSWEEESLCGP